MSSGQFQCYVLPLIDIPLESASIVAQFSTSLHSIRPLPIFITRYAASLPFDISNTDCFLRLITATRRLAELW